VPQPVAELVERNQPFLVEHGLEARLQQVEFVRPQQDARLAMHVHFEEQVVLGAETVGL